VATTSSAGGGTDVSNASVSGIIRTADGRGVVDVQVKLTSVSFLPYRPGSPESDSSVYLDTTNETGLYRFPVVKSDTYNIQAVHLTNRTRLFRSAIVVREHDSVQVPDDSLRLPGSIGIMLRPNGPYAANGIIFVPGTDLITRILSTSAPAVLDSVPAGRIPSIAYFDPSAGNSYSIVSNSVGVKPAGTAILGSVAFLVVTGNGAGSSAADSLIVSRLRSMGITVNVKSDVTITGSDASGSDVVLVSPTATSANLQLFKSSAVPMIVCQTRMYPLLDMTGTVQGVDYAVYDKGVINYTDSLRRNDIEMRDVGHPISPNIAGTQVICTDSVYMVWGVPTLKSKYVASVFGDIFKIVIFTYDTGELMESIPAPARRVGLSFHEDVFAGLNQLGWMLFDNSVYWALRMR